jgi:RNA polymerase sigma-70 factor (ECF subfamily)
MRQPDQWDERQLISRAKEGDMEAFELLVKKFQQSIYYLCLRMAGSPQAADDLSQETFIKAYFALPKFQDGMNFFSWIRRIAVNASLNYLKAGKREEPLGGRDNVIMDLPQNELQKNEIDKKFQEALKALPTDQKTVFVLRVFENQSYREIAQALDIAEGTVMSRLNRARGKLKAALADYLARRRP